MGQQCNYKYNCKLLTDVITCRYFLKYKYNVKTCMYTISALYQVINLNVKSTQRPLNIKWDQKSY